MDTLFCPWESSRFLIFSSNVPPLFYYSHLPAILISLMLGIFILFKDWKSLNSKILFLIILLFSLWTLSDLIQWATNRSDVVMALWSIAILLEALIFTLSLYFAYLFISKKDPPFLSKLIVGLLILPVIFLLPTKYNLSEINLAICDASEGFLAAYYIYFIELISAICILVIAIINYRKADKIFKRQIILITSGIILFLFAFSWGNIIGSFTEDWRYSQYGLFGMPVFMGFLAYLIVKHQAFNIKLLSIEALVPALVILIGSQFAFIQNTINQILTGIALAASVIFGYVLVRSIRTEAKEREKLATMTHELEHANQELKELDKVKSDFISIVSHQLRTPLTVTKGYTSMILEGGGIRIAAG